MRRDAALRGHDPPDSDGERDLLVRAQRLAQIGCWARQSRTGAITWSGELPALFGLAADESPSYRRLLDAVHAEDRAAVERTHRLALRRRGVHEIEYRVRLPDGELRWLAERSESAEGAQAGLASLVAVVQDVTARKLTEERMRFLAYHDALTGLPNRQMLGERLELLLERAARSGERLAVVFLDLDWFRHINDSLGHRAGDVVLVAMARRMQQVLRPGDLLVRHGGDGFVALLAGFESSGELEALLERLLTAGREPVDVDEDRVSVTLSLGVGVFPDNGSDSARLLANADAALHRAKAAGRNCIRFFEGRTNFDALQRVALEQELRAALRDGGFQLAYQPQVDCVGRICGLEALIRWNLPHVGLVSLDKFLPLAEELGLMPQLGDWVLQAACAQLSAWIGQGIRPPRVSINVSTGQLRTSDLVAAVGTALARHGVPAQCLGVELTESAAMEDPAKARRILGELKAMGLALAIDDFGTGYSSLSYLKLLPIDALKIDRSFVEDLLVDEGDRAIAAGTIALAHSLGLHVVAEGVETEGQAELLRRMGCDRMQGFLFGRPLPAETVTAMLRESSSERREVAAA